MSFRHVFIKIETLFEILCIKIRIDALYALFSNNGLKTTKTKVKQNIDTQYVFVIKYKG